MSRNSSGTHSLPEAPVVADTVIDPDWANNTLNDLSSELTDSLSRSGKGGMTAHMRGIDGTSAIPAYSFTDQITLGGYRAGSGDYRIAFNGTDMLKCTTAEVRSYSPLKVSAGGLTVDAGGLTVTAGGATITAGGFTAAGSTPANGAVVGGNTLSVANALSTTSGHSQPLTTAAKAVAVGNTVRLNVRTNNTGAVSGWEQVDLGISYDVDTSIASGGSLYLGKNGATVTSGTTATGATPSNALTLTNGNLKLSGTAPNKDVALSNTLTPANICKSRCRFTTDGAGGITYVNGYNVTGVALAGSDVRVTFATAFGATTDYQASANGSLGAVGCTNYTTTTVDVAGAGINFATNTSDISVLVF